MEKLAKHGPEKVYADREAALEDLRRFTRKSGLRPSIIISSGEGLHVYYVLDEAISVVEWKPRAQRLQELCEKHGLKVDAPITTDAARVLRAPGTTHKNGNRVRVIFWEGNDA